MAKGQITIFIILGIVIIFISVVGITVYNYMSNKKVEVKVQQEIPEGIRKEVTVYMDNCLKLASLEGLSRIGLQGGYITISPQVSYVQLDNQKVPLWLDSTSTLIPKFNDSMMVYKGFIEKKMNDCVASLANRLKPQNLEVVSKSIKADITVLNKVIVDLTTDLKVTQNDTTYSFEKFQYEVPIDLLKIYALARGLVRSEVSQTYLEFFTENVISLNSYLDQDALPPRYAFEVGFGTKTMTWKVDEVEEQLKGILQDYIPLISIKNTMPHGDKWDYHPGTSFKLFDDDYSDTKIDFTYDKRWGGKFEFEPTDNGEIKPASGEQSGQKGIPLIGMQEYETRYTAIFPVIVNITSYSSASIANDYSTYDENKGYSFTFGMIVALVYDYARVKQEEHNVSLEELFNHTYLDSSYAFDYIFCDYIKVADDTKKVSANVIDLSAGVPIKDVTVQIGCDEVVTKCFMGNTNEYGKIDLLIPNCTGNNSVFLAKEGYSSISYPLNETTKIYYLTFPRMLNISVKQMVAFDTLKIYNSTKKVSVVIKELPDDLSLTLIFVNKLNMENTLILYPKQKSITLPIGDYEVSISVLGEVNLPATNDPDGKRIADPYKGQMILGNSKYNITIGKDSHMILLTSIITHEPQKIKSLNDMVSVQISDNNDLHLWNTTLGYNRYKSYLEVGVI